MAPKQSAPVQETPAASSSEKEISDAQIESGEEAESDSEPEPQPQKQIDPAKKPETPAAEVAAEVTAAESTSYEEESTDSESSSDSDGGPPVSVVNSISKPMHYTYMIKKARTKASSMPPPVVAAPKPVAKRPIGKDDDDEKTPKRVKNVAAPIEPNETKQPYFRRVWSEDDEIVILKGMIEYIAREGADPYNDVDAFHDLIKEGLHIDVTRTQLMDKMRRLKKKFRNKSSKKKNGDDRTLSNPFEQKCFDLSKNIWGNEANADLFDQTSKSNGRTKKVQHQKAVAPPAVKEVATTSTTEAAKKDLVLRGDAEALDESILLDKSIIGDASNVELMKEGLSLMSDAKKAELVRKWKKLQSEEAEAYLRRVHLLAEQTKLVLEACKGKQTALRQQVSF